MGIWFWLSVSMLFPSALWNHSHLMGGSDAERLMSTLAYGWVERCSDIASYGTTHLQDKYFLCLISSIVFICLMNDEHVE